MEKNVKTAILFSGGLDSALLTKELLEKGKKPIPFCYDTGNNNFFFAEMLSDYLKLNKLIKIKVQTEDHNKLLEEAIKKILLLNEYDEIYIALTKNPPVNLGGKEPIRPEKISYEKIKAPYINKNKKEVLMNNTNEHFLIRYSHSCTESKKYRCNVCWQCKERAWAFKELGVSDIGLF